MLNTLEQINSDSRSHGIFLSISGPLSQDLMVEMGEILKRKMKEDGAENSVIHDVFAILVELNQNIIHYSAEKVKRLDGIKNLPEAGCGIMSVGYKDGRYFLISGNMIENHKIAEMKNKLTKLNRLTKEELSQWYREQRKMGPDPGSKGAGLGLIDVARKTTQPPEFDFEEIENHLSFFTLKIIV